MIARRIVKLGDYADTSSGGTPPRGNKEYFRGDIPWLKSGELPDGVILKAEEKITKEGLINSAAQVLPAGTLLMAMYGATVGKLGILGIPAATNQAVCAISPCKKIVPKFLFYNLLYLRPQIIDASFGGAQPNISQSTVQELEIRLDDSGFQLDAIKKLDDAFASLERAKEACCLAHTELKSLANSIIRHSIRSSSKTSNVIIGDSLNEVKLGIGEQWKEYRVLGATRRGLALAKEPPGKNPQRYKSVTHGTVFYNPMRIMIGSIAFVDDDDDPGITSPDYVVLKGKEGVVDSRWFYYWLRSPLGETCIQSLSRGAVRERMLFNRLAEGEIELPDYRTQLKASKALAEIRPMQAAIESQLKELELVPQKILAQTFAS